MLLTITYTRPPATDLGHLLHKHPARYQSFALSFGQAHVFYPEVSDESCTAALLLEVDPIGLSRGSRGKGGKDGAMPLQPYVNDRPYVASSFMSVAIAQVFGSALSGKSRSHAELVEAPLPLMARLAVLPCRGGPGVAQRLFEPLGYTVTAQPHLLIENKPEWGNSPYYTITLEANCRLNDLLSHLYVLIPVLDEYKHYYVGQAEVEKLLQHGEGWLPGHPERELITQRYLKHRSLVRSALARLVEEESAESDPDEVESGQALEEEAVEKPLSLNEQRLQAVMAALKESEGRRVLDLGCGEGRLLQRLLKESYFEEIVGVDVAFRTLEIARERLHLDRLAPKQQERLKLIQGSLTYRDKRLSGYDAAAVVEVIEHLDLGRLAAFERVLFEFARPATVVVTTPNVEYNVKFTTLPAGKLRHKDHRFEWTRQEFQKWASQVAARFGYGVQFAPIGPVDPEVGPPTQLAIFSLNGSNKL